MECLRTHRIGKIFAFVILLLTLSLAVAMAQTPPAQTTPAPTPSLRAASPSPSPSATPNPAQAATSPLSFSPGALDFGDHDIGTTAASQAVALKNNGKVAASISLSLSSDVEFTMTPKCSVSLDPGAECMINVNFTPVVADIRSAKLTVNYTMTGNPTAPLSQAVDLKGKGFIPKLSVSQSSLDFGQQIVGSTGLVRTLILTAGPEAVKVVAVNITGDFTVTPSTCSLTDPSTSCSLSVTFTPKRVGQSLGVLTIANDKTAPKIVSLKAEGLASCDPTPAFWSREEFYLLMPVVVIVLIYLLALVFVRWNMIARPTRNLLLAEIGAVRARVEILRSPPDHPVEILKTPPDHHAGLDQISQMLDSAESLVTGVSANMAAGGTTGFPQTLFNWLHTQLDLLLDHLFWTRGQELAAWGYVHEAEEQLVSFLPEQNVRAELERVEGELREEATPTAIGLADRIHEALAAIPLLPLDDPARTALNAVLMFLQPQGANLATDVSDALKPGATLTLEEWRKLAEKLLAFLTPQAASLAEQINQVLASPSPTVQELGDLLEQAAKLLESDALKLAAKLEEACAAETASPPSPLTAEDWKATIEKAREYLTPHASLVAQINLALAAKPEVPLKRWRALHSEALGYLYNRSDTKFAQLISWQNKTVWLVGCSLLLIVALAATLQHGILFLVGATGGLMSRLMRSLSREDVPTDYGASWSTLFLSPVVGALAGWSGILLVIVGVEFNILGTALKFDWCNTFNPVMLGLAFLLGFSERLFDGILDQLDKRVNTPTAAPPSSPPAAAITIVTAAVLPEGKVDQVYSQALAASGGTAPYKWTLASGTLPAGLNLGPGGQISGKPTAKGTAKFTLQVSDAAAKTQTLEFTIVIT